MRVGQRAIIVMLDRRRWLSLASAGLAGLAQTAPAQQAPRRTIPRIGGAALPPIGMGTWLTFNVSPNEFIERAQRKLVLQRFFAAGGGMIDSSPMYGHAERLVGDLLAEVEHSGNLYSATKVWTPFDRLGPGQLDDSLRLWRARQLDLVLVHNLLNWRAHLKTLRHAKDQGRVRAIGISTSHGRDHDEVQQLIRSEPLDAIQITYNFADPSAERVMNLAAQKGLGVVINRPFDGGSLFGQVGGKPLPAWAAEIDCANWAQFFLKWIISHPAVTCAIPATRNPRHMEQNMSAGLGRLPDAAQRVRMQAYFAAL
jgi:diketogulonate reductase-like aldo/keto reductase